MSIRHRAGRLALSWVLVGLCGCAAPASPVLEGASVSEPPAETAPGPAATPSPAPSAQAAAPTTPLPPAPREDGFFKTPLRNPKAPAKALGL